MHLVVRVHVHQITRTTGHWIVAHAHAAHLSSTKRSSVTVLVETSSPHPATTVGVYSAAARLVANAMQTRIPALQTSVDLVQHPTPSTLAALATVAHGFWSGRSVIISVSPRRIYMTLER